MLKAPANKILVQIEKKYQDKIGDLFIDTTYEPEEYATLCGKVVSVPDYIDDDPFRSKINQVVRPGDEVWFSYGIVFDYKVRREGETPEYKNLIVYEGEEYWQVDYGEVFCVRRDGKILIPTQNIILKPVEAQQQETKSGLVLISKSAQSQDVAEVVAVPDDLKCVIPGDRIPVEDEFKQRYILFGEQHFIIPVRRLIAKL